MLSLSKHGAGFFNGLLVVILAAVGLGTATRTIGTAIDVIALPLALISIALIATGIYRLPRRA